MRTSAFANGQTWDLPVPAQGASTHARFFDPAGAPSLAISCLTMLPSALETASAPGTIDFVAQWLAYALPYRRFAAVLANGNARLGADVVRYAFIVSDFHRLLLAGLPAHFESDHPSHAVGLIDVSRCDAAPLPRRPASGLALSATVSVGSRSIPICPSPAIPKSWQSATSRWRLMPPASRCPAWLQSLSSRAP